MAAPIPHTFTGYQHFEEMYRSERAFVYGIVLRMTGDKARADDLTQDSFVKVFLKMDSYIPQEKKDPQESFRNWLGTIAKNTALNYLKRRKMEFTYQETFQGDLQSCHHHTYTQRSLTPEELIIQKQMIESIDEVLENSPHLETAKLALLEGLAYKEIAELQGIPLGTVMSGLNRARQKLKDSQKYV